MNACPICKQQNRCTANASCWCMTVPIAREALAAIPKEKEGEVCICQACAQKYAQQSVTRRL